MEPQQITPTPVLPQPKPNHKVFYILIFIFIALVGSSAYLFLQNSKKEAVQSFPVQNGVEGWKTYRNEEYGFEFKYPKSVGFISPYDGSFQGDSDEGSFIISDRENSFQIEILNGKLVATKDSSLARQILSTFKFIKKPISVADYTKPFQKGEIDYYGTVTLTGYLVLNKEQYQDADILNYANFYITKNNNNIFNEYLNEAKNDFYRGDYIRLGCFDDNSESLSSTNMGDFDLVENKIIGSDLEYLLASSKSNLVSIQVSKSYISAGHGAPACYSHFRNFKLIR